jgi:hypothetical protein
MPNKYYKVIVLAPFSFYFFAIFVPLVGLKGYAVCSLCSHGRWGTTTRTVDRVSESSEQEAPVSGHRK